MRTYTKFRWVSGRLAVSAVVLAAAFFAFSGTAAAQTISISGVNPADGGPVMISNFKNIKDGELTNGQMKVVLQVVRTRLVGILEMLGERVEEGNPLYEGEETESESALFEE